MIRTTATILAISSIAVASFSTAVATAGVSPVGATGDNAMDALTSAYEAAYPRLSHAQATAAAAGADARRAVYDAAARDADSYGGAWFDPTTGVVNIAVTSAAASSGVREIARQYGVTVQTVRVKRSAAALEAAAAALRASRGELAKAANDYIGIDV